MNNKRLVSIILVVFIQISTWAPGAFGAIIMVGVSIYVFIKIYNHQIIAAFKENQAAPIPVSD